MANSRTEFSVGLFIVAGLAALGFLAFKVGDLQSPGSDDYYSVIAKFENIGGLKSKAAVTMAGVRLGRVGKIDFDAENFMAIVELRIDRKFSKLPVDTSASILTSGLLGAQYVGLQAGGFDEYLAEGGEIELTQSAVVLEQLIGQMIFSKASGEE